MVRFSINFFLHFYGVLYTRKSERKRGITKNKEWRKEREREKEKPIKPITHRFHLKHKPYGMILFCCVQCAVCARHFTATNIMLWTLPYFAPSNIADVFDLSLQKNNKLFVCVREFSLDVCVLVFLFLFLFSISVN